MDLILHLMYTSFELEHTVNTESDLSSNLLKTIHVYTSFQLEHTVFLSQILFLNKVDLFRDKIMNSDRHLRLYFPTYSGMLPR